MFDSLFNTTTAAETTVTLPNLLIALCVASVLGFLISFVYTKTAAEGTASPHFAITLVVLPAVITVIILLVGSNVARAFSLGGTFAIIRFRSAAGNPKDITYVLFTMAIGLAAGMGFVGYAVVIAIILSALMVFLEITKFGKPRGTAKILKITIPENLDYENVFDGVMQKYTNSSKLRRVKTTDLGSLYELTYSINTKKDISEKDFLDELRCRNGNLNITLVLDAPLAIEF